MSGASGPLSPEEVNHLDGTLLPARERHHLRLLAHALRTLQQIQGARQGDPPPQARIAAWLRQQPDIGADEAFATLLTAQLHSAGQQLNTVAAGLEPRRSALELDLDDLIRWAQAAAQQRCAGAQGPAIIG
jgi:hypothetical protein